jgi:hypothetical protein
VPRKTLYARLPSGRRNDIAHGVAQELSTSENAEMSWFLAAPNHQSQRTANWIKDDLKLRSIAQGFCRPRSRR